MSGATSTGETGERRRERDPGPNSLMPDVSLLQPIVVPLSPREAADKMLAELIALRRPTRGAPIDKSERRRRRAYWRD